MTEKRPRRKPKLIDIAASALVDKLPEDERKKLREAKVPAKQIIRMFTADHIILFTWGGPDEWWNYDMRRRGPELKKKDNLDTGRAAKAVRIDEKNEENRRKLLARQTGERPPEPKRKSRFGSRPMPGGRDSGVRITMRRGPVDRRTKKPLRERRT